MKTISPPTGGINKWHTETLVRRALNAKSHKIARNFLGALHWRGTKEVFDIAANLCDSQNAHDRDIGAQILEQLGVPERTFPKEALKILYDMLRIEREPDVLHSILFALGIHKILMIQQGSISY